MVQSLQRSTSCSDASIASLTANHISLQMLLEPGDALPLRIIHGFLVLLTAPIAPKSESMDLVLIDLKWLSAYCQLGIRSTLDNTDLDLMIHICFLAHYFLDLLDLVLIQ